MTCRHGNSISDAYSSAVDSTKTSDYKDMVEWSSKDESVPKSIKKFRLNFQQLDLRSIAQRTNAIYKGVLCLIAIEGGYDFDKNRSIGNKKYDKDHIFPKSRFLHENLDVNSILNMTWLAPDTNQLIKKVKYPSVYIAETIRNKYDGNEKEFLKTLESHFITNDAYLCMKENDFEGFLTERQKRILSVIGKNIGADTEHTLPSMTTPHTPYTNIRIIRHAIESCRRWVYWIDKFFAINDLDILIDGSKKTDLKEVKLLISLKNADHKMRSQFQRFKEEMGNKGTLCEMRVVTDHKIYGQYHDRWILSSNINFLLMSGDVARRGQYAEIKPTENRPPFEEWWKSSADIISQWLEISRRRELMGHRR